MNAAAKSIRYFGYYLIAISIVLITVPNVLLSTFMLPETSEVWIRVVGVLVLNIGLMYIYMANENNIMFFTLSCYLRSLILLWFIVFAGLKWVSPMLIPFGIVDFIGAIWTYTSLKKA